MSKKEFSGTDFAKGFESSFLALKECCIKLSTEEKLDLLGIHAGLALATEYSRAILEAQGYKKELIDGTESAARESYRKLRDAGDPSPKSEVFSEAQRELSKTRYIA